MNDRNSDNCDCVGPEEIDPLWNLHEDFSVAHAAALVAGYEPTLIDRCKSDSSFHKLFPKYGVTLDALTKSITNNRLRATLRYSAREYGYADSLEEVDRAECGLPSGPGSTAQEGEELSPDFRFFYRPFPDWSLSTVSQDDLTQWLTQRGIRAGFFSPNATDGPGYLDSEHPRYAPKLAAAVRAWEAVTDTNGKHPKQALTKWLREHCGEFDLADAKGKPNETGIEEIAKVANWQPSGGAPKTPGN